MFSPIFTHYIQTQLPNQEDAIVCLIKGHLHPGDNHAVLIFRATQSVAYLLPLWFCKLLIFSNRVIINYIKLNT